MRRRGEPGRPGPALRPARRSCSGSRRLDDDDWVALDDLADAPRPASPPAGTGPLLSDPCAGPTPDGGAERPGVDPARPGLSARAGPGGRGRRRAAGGSSSSRPLGRYVLALGPPPPPAADLRALPVRPAELRGHRLPPGPDPALIGQFSRFARWSQVGAALELKLTPESVYRGLEGGLTPEAMLDRLARHSPRPLPAGRGRGGPDLGRPPRAGDVPRLGHARRVRHAARTWRRPSALWPADGRVAPVRISDRLLLVEDEASIPFARFRMAGSRDYRRPPEACVEVEPDGVTLVARPRPLRPPGRRRARPVRRRAAGPPTGPTAPARPGGRSSSRPPRSPGPPRTGMTAAQLARWFLQRTGGEMPAAIRLLLHAAGARGRARSPTRRPVVMTVPDARAARRPAPAPRDRPATWATGSGRPPSIVPDDAVDDLRQALAGSACRSARRLPSRPEARTRLRRTRPI